MDKSAPGRNYLTPQAVLVILALFVAVPASSAAVCDADGDADVDRADIDLILAARNTPASGPSDPRDADDDGIVTVLDARKCSLSCSLPGCAVNHPPVADAGLDQNVFVGALVTLDGSASRDPDNGPMLLGYLWRFVSVPAGSGLRDADIANPTSAAASFTPDLPGAYIVNLAVFDGIATSNDQVQVTAAAQNVAPNADAGADQNAIVGAIVTLNGGASADPDNGPSPLGYLWTFVSVPHGSVLMNADLADPDTATPSFTPDVEGAYLLDLEVSDGMATAGDQVQVTSSIQNVAPNANAGPDQSDALVGAPVQLDGSGSIDPDNNPSPLSYQWIFVSVAAGSSLVDADVANANTENPSFTPDADGTYVLKLVVSDGELTGEDQVLIIAAAMNTAPIAANDDFVIDEDTRLAEDVLANDTDAQNDPLTATLVSDVSNGSLTLSPSGSFTYIPDANVFGMDGFSYVANDGRTDSNVATVSITVQPVNDAPTLDPIENVSLLEDSGPQTVGLTGIGAGANEIQFLTVTTTSDNPALIPDPSVSYSSPDVAGSLAFTPVGDQYGSALITVMVRDDGGIASSGVDTFVRTFTVTVEPVNDVPTLDPLGDLTVDEDAGPQTVSLTGISGGPNETQLLTVKATSSNALLIPDPTVAYTSPNAAGILTFTSAADGFGSATITVTVQDDGGTDNGGADTVMRTFAVIIRSVNDAPTLDAVSDVSIDEDAGLQVVDLTGISTGAANETQSLTVSATSSDASLIPDPVVSYSSPNPAGFLSFKPVANGFGSATITVTVRDDGGTDDGGVDTFSRSFLITVNPVNDAPTLDPIGSVTVEEGSGPHALDLTDITSGAANESQVLTVTSTSSNTALVLDPAVTYTSPNAAGTLTFTSVSGQSGNALITVSVQDDGGTANGGVDTFARTFTVTVTPALPTVTVLASDLEAAEPGLDSAAFTVSRIGSTANPLTVVFTIAGTAIEGLDYQAVGTGVTIPAGSASATVTVTPIDDSLFEPPETVVLTLAANASYRIGAPTTATVTILDDELPVVTVTTADSASEAGPDPGTFTVSRTGPTTSPLTVHYTMAGPAANGVDYETIATSVTIPVGSATGTVTITPIDDDLVEGAELVVITLESDSAYVVAVPAVAALNIADNDISVVTVIADDPDATEAGPTTGRFTFMRTGDTTAALDILVSGGGTATNGLDYASAVGANFIVTIPAGAASTTVTITPLPDNLAEGPETVVVTITPNLRYVVGTPETATVTIADDPVTVTLTATDPEAAEAGRDPGVFTFTRSAGNPTAALTVFYTRAGTASNASDFSFIGNSVTIPANQLSGTLTITPLPDNVVESGETVMVTIASHPSYLIGTPSMATVTIADDPAVVTVIASDPDASETGPDPGTFTYTRSGGNLAAALTVIASRSGTASNGLDYVSFSPIVTIPANQASVSVTVTPIDDVQIDSNETVVVTLSPSGSYIFGAQSTATVTIADNDSPAVSN